MRSAAGRLMSAAVACAALVGLLVAGPAGIGVAAPAADINQVAAQVRDLQREAAAAHEEATKAEVDLAAVRQKLGTLNSRMQRERDELTVHEAALGDLARSVYSAGGFDPTLQVLLADDPVEFLAQASVLDQVATSQADEIRQTQTRRLRLAQSEAEAADEEAQAQALDAQKSAAQAQVDDKLSQAKDLLAGLKQAERERLARIEEQRRLDQIAAARAAAEAAAALAAQAQSQAQAHDAPQGSNGESGSSSDQSEAAGGGYTGGSRAAAAVAYALSQVGDPYSYSASPPSSWDCSKLTAAAWGQAGVGLTALSYAQWDQTQHIPVDQIQPGDLVFYFGGGAHHVAMYIGNGKMVSASNPSDGVEITDFLGPWYKERFTGVGRVVG